VANFERSPSQMRVLLMLADSAQVADNKLFILGGGLTVVSAEPAPMAIAAKIDVPWDLADRRHDWKLELLDADGMPVLLGDRPVLVQGQFEVIRGEYLLPGTPLPMPLAVNFSGLQLTAGERFAWRMVIDDDTEPDWQVAFNVAAAPTVEV
jgi:hypothetical protein